MDGEGDIARLYEELSSLRYRRLQYGSFSYPCSSSPIPLILRNQLRDIALGLAYLHSKEVIHADMKSVRAILLLLFCLYS